MILYVCLVVLVLVSMWKIFEKAGRQGWEGIIPFYNMYVLLLIIKKPLWWFIMYFIPLVNIVFVFLTSIELAKKFGQGTGFGIGLALLSFIFFPILAFGDAQYKAE